MLKRPATVKILFALPLTSTLVWALLGAAQTNPFTLLKAGQLTGMKVEDSDGQKIGTIRNLILDTHSGELKYVVIGSGGFWGVHATLKLAPSQMMSADTTKRDTLAMHATHRRWNHAPVFKASNLASLAEPENAREISRYFELSAARGPNTVGRALSSTGNDTGTNMPQVELKFASDLMGRRVVNKKEEKIGELSDLIVSFGRGRSVFAIVSTGKVFHHGHQYAVPLNSLIRKSGETKLTLDADAAALEQAPPFDQQNLQAASTNDASRIYNYSKSEE
jgi:sporulation protein YlmC with PRC-barrel domain